MITLINPPDIKTLLGSSDAFAQSPLYLACVAAALKNGTGESLDVVPYPDRADFMIQAVPPLARGRWRAAHARTWSTPRSPISFTARVAGRRWRNLAESATLLPPRGVPARGGCDAPLRVEGPGPPRRQCGDSLSRPRAPPRCRPAPPPREGGAFRGAALSGDLRLQGREAAARHPPARG